RYSLRAAQQEKPHDEAKDAELLDRLTELRSAARSQGPAGAAAAGQAAATGGAYRIGFKPGPGFFASGNDALKLFRVLDGMGSLSVRADLSGLPDAEQFDPEKCYLAWSLELRTERPREEVADVFGWVEDDCEVALEAPEAPAAAFE